MGKIALSQTFNMQTLLSPTPTPIFYLPFFNIVAIKLFLEKKKGGFAPPCPPPPPRQSYAYIIKLSLYRPGEALRVPEGWDFKNFYTIGT
jgi:hypothetical protein